MSKCIDLTGQKFGRLTVIERTENHISPRGKTYAKWRCVCECGNYIDVQGRNLRSGETKSCGCFAKEKSKERMTTHGHCKDRVYNILGAMKQRCYNSNHNEYHIYGGRGITICDEWLGEHGTENFIEWALSSGYRDDLTIDRIDADGNYEPSNCRWVTRKEQNLNKRNNHLLTYNGKTQTMKQWADETGIKFSTISTRLQRGWSIERTLTKIPKG